MARLKKGMLIAFEGIDGAGKSTQARSLSERLDRAGFDVVLSKEPTDGRWGRRLKALIQNGRGKTSPAEEAALFLKDRQEHVRGVIRPGLEEKKVVILDRYYFSTMAYQGALGLNPEEIERENRAFAPEPDLVFLLEITSAAAVRRIVEGRTGGGDVFEQEDYLQKVNDIFGNIQKPFFCRLPGLAPVEYLERETWTTTVRHLEERCLATE